jgi:hypothetical protein
MADDLIEERIRREGKPDPKKVRSRADAMRHRGGQGREGDVDDPEEAAEQLLAESEERTESDPAPRTLDEDRVERRRTDDWTPPPDQR